MSYPRASGSLYIPDYIEGLVPYPPGKPMDELRRELGLDDIIKLASNENPLGPSPLAMEAVKRAVSSLHRYPDGSAYALKRAVAVRHGVPPEGVVLGNGSNELIELLVRVLVRPGCEVISSEPSFLVYRNAVQAAGGDNVIVRLSGLRHDLATMARSATPKTRIIFLDNPNNPTGSILDREEFGTFLSSIPHHTVVVLDEAYMEFVEEPGLTASGVDYIGKDSRVVTLRTFSKAYGLAGLRVGFGLMAEELASYLERMRQPFNVNSLAQVGALAAIEDEEHLRKTIEITRAGKAYLASSLTGLGCRVLPSQTNFILADMRTDGKKIFERMLLKGVIIRAMGAYGLPNHIRITVGTPEENERCIEALALVLSDLRS